MRLPDRAAHALRRTREVGIAGLARRLVQPLRARERSRLAALFDARWSAPPTDADLLARVAQEVRPRLRDRPGASAADELDRLRLALGRGAFFFDGGDASLRRELGARRPRAVEALLEQADAALRGDLAWVVPGGTPDWHRALPGDGRWPVVPPRELGLDGERPRGDVRLAWEVARCPHLVRLAQAAWLTGDERYARAAVEGLRSFASENPPGLGIAWADAQEVALRALAWLWVFHLIRASAAFDVEAFRTWLATVLAHADFVRAHLSDHVITHNHLVSELAALSVLALALPELEDAPEWRERAMRPLWREVRKQVDDEGVHGEHSTHYHAFVLDSLVAVVLLADRRGVAVPDDVRRRIAAMADFVAALVRDDGTLPALGDTDAGRAFRLGHDPLDRRDTLALAALAFGDRSLGAVAGDAPGAFWLSDGRRVPGASDRPPPGFARRFEAAGLGVARSGHGADAESVVFRAGATRFRPDVATGHAHADALSVVYRLGSDDVLVDPGTYLYSESDGWRRCLRGTSAHSCVVVDGRDQADVSTLRFGVIGLRPSRWLAFAGDDDHLEAEAEHPLGGEVRVRRRVLWRRGGVLLLCDAALGEGAHALESRLQLAAAREITADDAGGGVVAVLENGLSVRVQVFGPIEKIDWDRGAPPARPGAAFASSRYGRVEPCTTLRFDLGRRTLPASWVTVLQAGVARVAPAEASATAGGTLRVRVGSREWTLPPTGGRALEDRV